MNNHRFVILSAVCIAWVLTACRTDVPWEVEQVKITMKTETVSAGFVECAFSTDKDAYYLIACEPVQQDYDPATHAKQFMLLAIDSAYADYLMWRSYRLKSGEFNVAPFASHVLQYGDVRHFFTGLKPDTDYWVYAFVVNPETLKPGGTLHIQTVRTEKKSVIPIRFEYRVKGYWDYLYPVDTLGHVYSRYPYVATTRDSIEIAQSPAGDASVYFDLWLQDMADYAYEDNIYFGVRAINNDGWHNSYLAFEEGHTYYTVLASFDGGVGRQVVYKFLWNGPQTEYYFTEKDAESISENWYMAPRRRRLSMSFILQTFAQPI